MIHNNVFPVRSRRLLHLLLSRSLDFPPKGLREKGMLVGGREGGGRITENKRRSFAALSSSSYFPPSALIVRQ